MTPRPFRLTKRTITLVQTSEGLSADAVGPRLGLQVLFLFLRVLGVAVVVAAGVSYLVGPAVFREHIGARQTLSPAAQKDVQDAYVYTVAIASSLAVTAAFAVASLASVFFARRFAVAVANLSDAAYLVRAGRYDFAVQATGLGPEIGGFADTFNDMAARLNAVEATRRRLLSDLAHEIRTPIATLDGYLEAFEDGIARPDPATLAMLRQQTRRMSRLVADISSISRVEEHQVALERQPMTVTELVHSCGAAARGRYDAKGVTLTLDVAAGIPLVDVDRERMEQVVGNLLDNALRHTPSGGSVALSASTRSDGWAVISVADTGEGIPPEHLPRVFERFYRVDEDRGRSGGGGSGIGLSIVRALVAEHGGTVTASSTSAGATFVVSLPPAEV